jgi:hypothetical protein
LPYAAPGRNLGAKHLSKYACFEISGVEKPQNQGGRETDQLQLALAINFAERTS